MAAMVGFKYTAFLAENVLSLIGAASAPGSNPFLSIVVPLGLSFQAFQALSYLFLEVLTVMVIVDTLPWLDSRARAAYPLERRWAPLRAVAYAGIVIGLLEFSAVKAVPFIYVQF